MTYFLNNKLSNWAYHKYTFADISFYLILPNYYSKICVIYLTLLLLKLYWSSMISSESKLICLPLMSLISNGFYMSNLECQNFHYLHMTNREICVKHIHMLHTNSKKASPTSASRSTLVVPIGANVTNGWVLTCWTASNGFAACVQMQTQIIIVFFR